MSHKSPSDAEAGGSRDPALRSRVSKSVSTVGGVRGSGVMRLPQPHLAVATPASRGPAVWSSSRPLLPLVGGPGQPRPYPGRQRMHGCPSAGLPLMSLGHQERDGLFSWF